MPAPRRAPQSPTSSGQPGGSRIKLYSNIPQSTERRRRHMPSGGSGTTGDLADVTGLVGRWKIESIAAGDGVKFTSWVDSSPSPNANNTMNNAANGGLTKRATAAAFGNLAVAEAAAATDGLYISSGFFNTGVNLARPFTWVIFCKGGAGAANGDIIAGNASYFPLGKAAGSVVAEGPGSTAMFWTGTTTVPCVLFVEYGTTTGNSQLYYNGTIDSANGNLNTTAGPTGEIGIGHNSTQVTTAGSQVHEMGIFNKQLSAGDRSTIMTYYRTKSGLALT